MEKYRLERFRQGSPYAQKGINSQSSEHGFLWVLMKLGSPTSIFTFGFTLTKIAHENSADLLGRCLIWD